MANETARPRGTHMLDMKNIACPFITVIIYPSPNIFSKIMKLKLIVPLSSKRTKNTKNNVYGDVWKKSTSTSHVSICNSQEPHQCSLNYVWLIWVQSRLYFAQTKELPMCNLRLGIFLRRRPIVSFTFYFYASAGWNKQAGGKTSREPHRSVTLYRSQGFVPFALVIFFPDEPNSEWNPKVRLRKIFNIREKLKQLLVIIFLVKSPKTKSPIQIINFLIQVPKMCCNI